MKSLNIVAIEQRHSLGHEKLWRNLTPRWVSDKVVENMEWRFLKTGAKGSAQGNFGLMDLVAGLHWLRENLPAFGGDVERVTLMGHDTGAALVNFIAVSPVAKGKDNGSIHGERVRVVCFSVASNSLPGEIMKQPPAITAIPIRRNPPPTVSRKLSEPFENVCLFLTFRCNFAKAFASLPLWRLFGPHVAATQWASPQASA
ncbi:hypothetical protein GWI33_018474 [Rhynchophorus ferrugineus]|uniref:Carboxylesterase type B domain-containing protein n=1 Tax=Rhynchophorus ferrugineus TaxID=354439 RepID=A0A834HVX8_RHYFE|nr:hypothetical protein GWI33_018474 [Rhynchophorus ferrugineus]